MSARPIDSPFVSKAWKLLHTLVCHVERGIAERSRKQGNINLRYKIARRIFEFWKYCHEMELNDLRSTLNLEIQHYIPKLLVLFCSVELYPVLLHSGGI